MRKIVFLPLDERPCNSFAARMSEGNPAFDLVLPQKSLLGDKKIPANAEALAEFLRRECADADALVLSVDMLLYGGIVPSRLHKLREGELVRRLSVLKELKAASPALKIYAYALVMRCPHYSSADEEPDYYELCGREIFLTGQLEHKYKLGLVSETEYAQKRKEYGEKTGEYLSDFLARRKTNLNLLLKTVRLYGSVIDYLVLPQDDSAEYGYTTMDREALLAAIKREKLARPLNYPGADEVGMTLLARAVNEQVGTRPKVAAVYACEEAKKLVPLYEDRPLEKSVCAQIEAAGCELADENAAELLLFINAPADKMINAGGEKSEGYKQRDLAAFAERIAEAVKARRCAAVADVAYCNGGDKELVKLLSEKISLFALAAYAGWNTSSNTLGTAIAQGVLYLHYGNTATHRRFLAERFYEDVGYCGHVRKLVCETKLAPLGLDYFHADGKNGVVSQIVKDEIARYIGELLPEIAAHYEISDCEMPWRRMFEVDLRAREIKDKEKGV